MTYGPIEMYLGPFPDQTTAAMHAIKQISLQKGAAPLSIINALPDDFLKKSLLAHVEGVLRQVRAEQAVMAKNRTSPQDVGFITKKQAVDHLMKKCEDASKARDPRESMETTTVDDSVAQMAILVTRIDAMTDDQFRSSAFYPQLAAEIGK